MNEHFAVSAKINLTKSQMRRCAEKASVEEQVAVKKCQEALAKHQESSAKLYAQQSVQKRMLSQRFLTMFTVFDVLDGRMKEKQLNESAMSSINDAVVNLSSTLDTKDVNKVIEQLNQFERKMENLQVIQATMTGASQRIDYETEPSDVTQLLNNIRDVTQIDTLKELPSIKGELTDADTENLEERLAHLRSA